MTSRAHREISTTSAQSGRGPANSAAARARSSRIASAEVMLHRLAQAADELVELALAVALHRPRDRQERARYSFASSAFDGFGSARLAQPPASSRKAAPGSERPQDRPDPA